MCTPCLALYVNTRNLAIYSCNCTEQPRSCVDSNLKISIYFHLKGGTIVAEEIYVEYSLEIKDVWCLQ